MIQKKSDALKTSRSNQRHEGTMMSKKLWIVWAAVAFGATAQTSGPNVGVSVNPGTGAVTVSPNLVVVPATASQISWTLGVRSHRFASSGGVSIPASSGFSCSNQDNDSKVVCSRTTTVVGEFAYTLNLVPIGTAKPAGVTPNVWVVSE
jgi:hypothetical protein